MCVWGTLMRAQIRDRGARASTWLMRTQEMIPWLMWLMWT